MYVTALRYLVPAAEDCLLLVSRHTQWFGREVDTCTRAEVTKDNQTHALVILEGTIIDNNLATIGAGGGVVWRAALDLEDRQRCDMWCDSLVGNDTLPPMYRSWFAASRLEVNDCVLTGNAATCSTCSGGALSLLNGDTRLHNSIVASNHAGLNGGGVFVGSGSTKLLMSRSQLLDNDATTAAQLFAASTGNVTVLDSTMTWTQGSVADAGAHTHM